MLSHPDIKYILQWWMRAYKSRLNVRFLSQKDDYFVELAHTRSSLASIDYNVSTRNAEM